MAQVNLTGSRAKTVNPTFETVKELVRRYNAGQLSDVSEKDLEQISILAAQFGLEFDVASKPIRKGLFDLVDTAAFGLIPNRLRPTSIGQEWHGESGIDKFAGGLGTLGGAIGTGAALFKGTGLLRQGISNSKIANLNPLRDKVVDKAGNVVSKTNEMMSSVNQGLLTKAFKNVPNPRTGNIADEIFGPRF
tara:strand:- start:9090 stop:9662 length:573 start_codon:yes stop_codon:yes gene_type:complete